MTNLASMVAFWAFFSIFSAAARITGCTAYAEERTYHKNEDIDTSFRAGLESMIRRCRLR